ncbi:hypothetical protein pb186bvf_006818 [Paramecium bursaria]
MQKLNDRSIFISNIDTGITEDYLYRKFKQFGEMQSLKVIKPKHDKDHDKIRAVIVYTHEDSALEARQQLHNKILIRNMIKVKPFLESEQFNPEARIYVGNLPETSDDFELEELFRGYGKILNIDLKTDQKDKLLRHCSILYENQDDAKQLLAVNPEIKYHGNVLKIDKYLTSKERNEQDTSIYWRAFARPLQQAEINNEQIIAYEIAWHQVIQKNLSIADYKIECCQVKFDKQNMQPWATIKFDSVDSKNEILEECEKQKSHTGFKSCANEAIYLLSQLDTIESDGQKINKTDAIEFLQQFIGTDDDPFLGESDNFFFNQSRGIQKVDDRLLIVQNIRPDVDENYLGKYLSKFGKIIKLTLKKSTNPKFRTQKCFVQFQTQQDAENAIISINERSQESDALRYLIFDGGKAYVNVLIKKNVRKGFKNLKEKQQQFNPPNHQGFPNQSPKKFIAPPPQLPFYSNNQLYQQPYQPYQQYQQRFYPQAPYNYRPNNKRNNYENSFQQSRFNQGSTISSIRQDKEVFIDYKSVQKNMNGFSKLNQTKQREILGQLLTQRIKQDNMVKNEADIPKIIAMLIDPEQFEISEILNFLENQEELIDWVQEGVDLLLEESLNLDP